MQANDIIIVNTTGTNGSTRNQKVVTKKFNGAGLLLDDNGQVMDAPDRLRALPNGEASKAPDFPMEAFVEAQQKGLAGADEVNKILIAHAEQTKKWQESAQGGDEKLVLVKSVLGYLKEFHGFREEDGNHFVIKPENLAVQTATLADKRTLYTVTGTAVFGA